MSSAQLADLIEPIKADPEIEVKVEPPQHIVQEKTVIDQPVAFVEDIPQEEGPSTILSQPPKVEEASSTSKVLKTRKGLIQQIRTVCRERNIDPKPLNLARRRKNSLQGIIQNQLREAIQKEMEPEVPTDHQEAMGVGPPPEDLNSKERFACDMAMRLDFTLCMVFERVVGATGKYHGMTCDGFSKSLQESEGIQSEIRSAWLEIIQEEDNQWILEYVSAPMRLFLAHAYGLAAVLRAKEPKEHVKQAKKSVPVMEPKRSTGKLRDIVMQRKASRKVNIAQKPLHPRTGILAV